MNTLSPLNVPGQASSRFYKLCATILNTTPKRHQSSYRRARTRMNIRPDPSFLPSKTVSHDHIIHNPPPSMPNVYHTPSLFLPKSDTRKQLETGKSKPLLLDTPAYGRSGEEREAPPVRPPYQKRYHLKEEDLVEMRRLRRSDPFTWSAKALARRFDCSVIFVSTATEGIAKQKKFMQEKVTEAVKSRWGAKRRVAREDRQLRREKWYKDE